MSTEILAEARKVSDAQLQRAKEEVEAERQRRLEETRRQIEAETARAIDQIRGEVADLTVEATQRVVGKVLDILGTTAVEEVHNHHNFAWLEEHDGQEVWVVRKGCTPAFPGQRGFVGGSIGGQVSTEYLQFAGAIVLMVGILIASYWFVYVPNRRDSDDEQRTRQ